MKNSENLDVSWKKRLFFNINSGFSIVALLNLHWSLKTQSTQFWLLVDIFSWSQIQKRSFLRPIWCLLASPIFFRKMENSSNFQGFSIFGSNFEKNVHFPQFSKKNWKITKQDTNLIFFSSERWDSIFFESNTRLAPIHIHSGHIVKKTDCTNCRGKIA